MNHPMTAPAPDNPTPIRLFWVYLLLITALAGGLRLYNVGQWSLWEDELFSVRSASNLGQVQLSKRFGQLPTAAGLMAQGVDLGEVRTDNTAQWRSLGVEAFGARIGPCLVGILSITLLGWASRRLLGDRAALIAALLLAVSPWHVFWSQAARFYTIQFLFYNLALIWYLRTCQMRSTRLAVLAGGALLLAYLSQPPALVLSVVLAGDVLLCLIRRKPIGLGKAGWTAGLVSVAVCLGLLLYDKMHASADWEAWGHLQGHSWKVIAASMVLRNHPVVLAVAALSALALIRSRPRLTLYLVLGAALPVLALMALSLGGSFYVHERYCFVVHYAWLALAAMGLAAVWESVSRHHGAWLAGSATAAVVVTLLWADLSYYTHGHRRRWNDAFAYVTQHRQPGEDVAVLSSKGTPIARYYLETDDVLAYAEFPTSPQKLQALDRPTWLVLPAVSATRGELFPWLNDEAVLKRYYDLRVLQPFSSVRVYYYLPDSTSAQNPG